MQSCWEEVQPPQPDVSRHYWTVSVLLLVDMHRADQFTPNVVRCVQVLLYGHCFCFHVTRNLAVLPVLWFFCWAEPCRALLIASALIFLLSWALPSSAEEIFLQLYLTCFMALRAPSLCPWEIHISLSNGIRRGYKSWAAVFLVCSRAHTNKQTTIKQHTISAVSQQG